MKTKTLFLCNVLLCSAFLMVAESFSSCAKKNDIYSATGKNKGILKVLKDEPAIVRKHCFEHVGRVDTFFFELVNRYPEFSSDDRVFPAGEIPVQYRKEGLSVKISGNVTSCVIATIGCLDTQYYRLRPNYLNLFELKSIKINK